MAIPESSQLSDRESYPSESASRELENFDRLDRLVRALLQRHQALQGELADLRARLEERDARVRTLEGKILESNQTRRDAGKRLDDLIAQLDHLDSKLGGGAKVSSDASAD